MPSTPTKYGRARSRRRWRKLGKVPVPHWIWVIGKTVVWLCKRPQTLLLILVTLAVRKYTGEWQIAEIVFAILAAIASVIYLARHPFLFRTGLRSSITALSRRRRIKKRWRQACLDTGLWRDTKTEPRIARLAKVRITNAGNVTAFINAGSVGRTTEHVSNVAAVIAACVRCPYVAVRNSKSHPGATILEFRWNDELAAPLSLKDIADVPVRRDRLTIGRTESGFPANISLTVSMLLVGLTRSGKSNTVWAALAWLNRLGIKVRLWVFDPKGGMELQALKPVAHRYAVSTAECAAVLHECVSEMNNQARKLAESGSRKFSPGGKFPLNLVIVDEFLALTFFVDGQTKNRIQADLGALMTQGAAVGYVGWFATQAAQIDTLGRIRTFVPQRLCWRVDTVESAIAALGPNARQFGKAHEISENTPGIGYMSVDGQANIVRFRSAFVPDSAIPEIIAGKFPRHEIGLTDLAASKLPRGNILRHAAAIAVRVGRWVARTVRCLSLAARARVRRWFLSRAREAKRPSTTPRSTSCENETDRTDSNVP